MLSSIRKRMTWANVAMTLALVFAMAGGAFAAGGKHHKKAHKPSGVVITSTKQISPKVIKALRGNVGPQGPAGISGKDGANGKDGLPGAEGKAGKDGVSVTGKALAAGEGGCSAGGVAYTSATGASSVCNGQNGTFSSEPLPSGQTLTGVWATSGEGIDLAQISFSISVSPAPTAVYHDIVGPYSLGLLLEEEKVSFFPNANPGTLQELEEDEKAYATDCPGSSSNPKAAPGFLCIYPGKQEGSVSTPTNAAKASEAASDFGAIVPLSGSSNSSSLRGTWAVTAK